MDSIDTHDLGIPNDLRTPKKTMCIQKRLYHSIMWDPQCHAKFQEGLFLWTHIENHLATFFDPSTTRFASCLDFLLGGTVWHSEFVEFVFFLFCLFFFVQRYGAMINHGGSWGLELYNTSMELY